MVSTKKKTPLDYVAIREKLAPVQVRLSEILVEQVKQKLARDGLTFTDLVKGACYWYINEVDDLYNPILDKKKTSASRSKKERNREVKE